MKIGIFAPYLLVYGGGEKYICKIAEIFSREHDVDLLAFDIPEREVTAVLKTLENRLNVNLKDVNLKIIATSSLAEKNFTISMSYRLTRNSALSKRSKQYDLFINQSVALRFPAPACANKNVMIVQAPPTKAKLPNLLDRIGTNVLDTNLTTYDRIVVYSKFVKKRVEQRCAREADVLYPPIDIPVQHSVQKECLILSVGRFFMGWHNKKQLEMIQAFRQLCADSMLGTAHWEYHLVGGVLSDKRSQLYKKRCEQEAEGYPIFFHFNAPTEIVKDLYRRSMLFWHATGFDEDEDRHPEKMEHFGIVTAEAMSYGCVPVVVGKGGQPEIVSHGINGLLWNNVEELKESTIKLIRDSEKRAKLAEAAIETSRQFQADQFETKVRQLFI
ncbi:MAG: glycosyltransferase family 4 protein [Halobacteriota archaeon]